MRWSKGFTLIEMLVVIAIISILIGIGVNTFTIAQKKARDVRRKADLNAMATILELYRHDTGSYCPGGSPCAGGWDHPFDSSTWGWNGRPSPSWSLKAVFVPAYISVVPHDPLNFLPGAGPYKDYYLNATNTTYILSAILENTGDADINSVIGVYKSKDGSVDCATDNGNSSWNYCIHQ